MAKRKEIRSFGEQWNLLVWGSLWNMSGRMVGILRMCLQDSWDTTYSALHKKRKGLSRWNHLKQKAKLRCHRMNGELLLRIKTIYYLYVVNYALSEPKLIIVQDPYNKLKDIAKIVPLQDFKVIIPKLESWEGIKIYEYRIQLTCARIFSKQRPNQFLKIEKKSDCILKRSSSFEDKSYACRLAPSFCSSWFRGMGDKLI